MPQPLLVNLGPSINRGILSAVGAGIDIGGPGAGPWTTAAYVDELDPSNRWEVEGFEVYQRGSSGFDGGGGQIDAATVCGPTTRTPAGVGWENPLLLPQSVMEVEGPSVLCSTFGMGGFADETVLAEAKDRLYASMWNAIAAEIWDGAGATAVGNDNMFFTKAGLVSTPLGVTPVPMHVALTVVETALEMRYGRARHLVHASAGSVNLMAARQLLASTPNSDRVLTWNGNVVVADPGYPGTGPAGSLPTLAAGTTTGWIVGTPRMRVLLGEPYPVQGVSPMSEGKGVTVATNDVQVTYRQPFGYFWPGAPLAVRFEETW